MRLAGSNTSCSTHHDKTKRFAYVFAYFSLDNANERLYIWITLRSFDRKSRDVRENRSMKNATKQAAKKAPAKKAAATKKKK